MNVAAVAGVTPVGLRPPFVTPTTAIYGHNRQGIHLSAA